ncbi:MAG: antitoxin, partial [Cyanobium sp.]
MINTDTNRRYQQNLRQGSLAILVLTTTSWPRIRQFTVEIQAAIAPSKLATTKRSPFPEPQQCRSRLSTLARTHARDDAMDVLPSRVFMNGNSQAVRIPAEFRLSSDRVQISRTP